MIWYDMIQLNTILYDIVWTNTVWHNLISYHIYVHTPKHAWFRCGARCFFFGGRADASGGASAQAEFINMDDSTAPAKTWVILQVLWTCGYDCQDWCGYNHHDYLFIRMHTTRKTSVSRLPVCTYIQLDIWIYFNVSRHIIATYIYI